MHRLSRLTLVLVLLAGIAGIAGAQGLPSDPDEQREAVRKFLAQMDPAEQKRAPFRIFDELYYVGIDWVGAYLLVTSEGLILIDTTYGEYTQHLMDGIRELGFDPADIAYVFCTHAHFDHAGGAAAIRAVSGARVGMTEGDWAMLESREAMGHYDFEPVERDLVLADGDTLTLGETTLRFYHTPGHTPGVLSLEFTVHDAGEPHKAFTFGGVGLNFSGVERTRAYMRSVRRLMQLEGIEVNLPNHAAMGRVFERAAQLQSREPGEPHPFVDPAGFRRWLDLLLDNAGKKLTDEMAR